MAKLTLNYSDIYKMISVFLGLPATPTGTDLTKVKQIAARGYRKFLYPINVQTGSLYTWSFVKQFMTLTTVSGSWKYPLPDNFSEMIDVPHFDDQASYTELTKLVPETILEKRSASISNGFPLYYALAPHTFDNAVGTFYEMWMEPIPDGAYPLKFFYRIDPLAPSADGDFFVGGIRAIEALTECCLAKAEQQENDAIGFHTQLADQLIQELIQSDVQDTTSYLGNMSAPHPMMYRWYSAVNPNTIYENEGGVIGAL